MVTIRNYSVHENAEGKRYVSLELIGDVEMILSKQTGRFYATVKKCVISSSFDELTAKLMLGRNISGTIIKKECEPYPYTLAGTGEIVSLTHKYEYIPD